jgi:hypothetical protein
MFSIARKPCFAEGCKERVPKRLLMCQKHWNLVPHELRVEIYAGLDIWRSGGSPQAYIEAIKRARAAVAAKERK